jgi:hypothetical protein
MRIGDSEQIDSNFASDTCVIVGNDDSLVPDH